MKRTAFLSALALTTAVAIGCNDRRDATDVDTTAPGSVGTAGTTADLVSSSDKAFVSDLTIANMAEVELGRLALDHSKNAEVKKFAQMMVDDHTSAGEKLGAVASQYNIDKPAQLDDTHRALRNKLETLQGAEFDREYMGAMVDGHGQVLDRIEARIDKQNLADWKTRIGDRLSGKSAKESGEPVVILAEKSDNPATMSINQWAADSYETVYKHHEAAKNLDKAVGKRTLTQ